jgi:uncharacterized protein (TIGR02118 family)
MKCSGCGHENRDAANVAPWRRSRGRHEALRPRRFGFRSRAGWHRSPTARSRAPSLGPRVGWSPVARSVPRSRRSPSGLEKGILRIGRRHMVKMVAFFKRKPGMSVEAFQSYWRTTHAGIVLKMPGIRRYVQSHTLLNGYRKGEPAYDGVAEVWFDDTKVMRALAQSPEYAAVRAMSPTSSIFPRWARSSLKNI